MIPGRARPTGIDHMASMRAHRRYETMAGHMLAQPHIAPYPGKGYETRVEFFTA